MKATMRCLPCIVRQAVDIATNATDDPEMQRKAMHGAFDLLSQVDIFDTPMNIGQQLHRVVGEITNAGDPYKSLKVESNAIAMDLYDRMVATVAEAVDPLRTAAKVAIAGNIMDFGALAEFDVESTIEKALQSEFAIGDFDIFKQRLSEARNVLYLADNAGEIVFDRVFIEQMRDVDVTVALKSRPFINDAMIEDAVEVGLDKVAKLITVAPGATTGEEFDEAWQAADLIIAKGQGNYEVFSEVTGPIFYLLIAKCPVIAGEIGVNEFEMILQSQINRRAQQ